MPELTSEDLSFILESLGYSKLRFESTEYPTYELKQRQMQRVESVIAKIRQLKSEK